jgi:hypothetical protein
MFYLEKYNATCCDVRFCRAGVVTRDRTNGSRLQARIPILRSLQLQTAMYNTGAFFEEEEYFFYRKHAM